PAYGITVISAMMTSLSRLAEGRPHGDCDSADSACGPLAVGAGSGPQAQRVGPHRYLLPAAPRAYPLPWPVRRGPAPRHSRWSSWPVQGGGTLGGARHAPRAPGWPRTRVAERLPPRSDSRGAVRRES